MRTWCMCGSLLKKNNMWTRSACDLRSLLKTESIVASRVVLRARLTNLLLSCRASICITVTGDRSGEPVPAPAARWAGRAPGPGRAGGRRTRTRRMLPAPGGGVATKHEVTQCDTPSSWVSHGLTLSQVFPRVSFRHR